MHVSIINSRFKTFLMFLITLGLVLTIGCDGDFPIFGSADNDEVTVTPPTTDWSLQLEGVWDWSETAGGYGNCNPDTVPSFRITPSTSLQTKRLELKVKAFREYSEITRDNSGTVVFSESGTWEADENSITFIYEGQRFSFLYTNNNNIFKKWYYDCGENYWMKHTYQKR